MQLFYSRQKNAILEYDAIGRRIATMSNFKFVDVPAESLAKAMAIGPELVCLIDSILSRKGNRDGGQTLSREDADALALTLHGLQPTDLVALTPYIYIVKGVSEDE